MTAEELDRIDKEVENAPAVSWSFMVKDVADLLAEVRRLHGIQKILADCREESSAWADGYRTASKEMEVVQKALRLACDEIVEHNADYHYTTPSHVLQPLRSLADRVFTPESSLAKQRQKETTQ